MNHHKSLFILSLLLSLTLGECVYAEEIVRMGFYQGSRREMSFTEVRDSFALWSEELAATFNVPIRVTFYDDIKLMRQAFDRDEINAVSADGMALARTFKLAELADGYSVAMPAGWDLMLLARRDSGVKSMHDFSGKRLVMLDNDPAANIYMETLCLQYYARPCKQVFAEIQKQPTNNQAVMRLFFGKADVLLVYRYGYTLASEMNPQVTKNIGAVLQTLPLEAAYFAFFSSRVNKDFRNNALRFVPIMHTYPRGRQLMDMFKMDHLELASPQALLPYLQLDQRYRELQARQGKKAKMK